MEHSQSSRRIHVLRDSEARKIAAGEVIDRPLSVVRELIDNAIDAGASEINVYVEGGGIKRIRVSDDGIGMNAADLDLCVLPHATSKITTTEDIYSVNSLGFRGEALASIAACSKLEITSRPRDTDESAGKIIVHAAKVISHGETSAPAGTTVEVRDLFYSMPGRRKFLKRVASETQACRQAFIEKALPFPDISFRLFIDGDMKLFLPPQNLLERVSTVFERSVDRTLWDSIEKSGTDADDIRIRAVLTRPDYFRRDRRLIQVYVNNRRVTEYALLQAVTYGYSEHQPGGAFPAVVLMVDVDPAHLDFNIHPAKREVRFKNLPGIHRAVVDAIRSHLSHYKIRANLADPNEFRDPQEALIREDVPGYSTGREGLPQEGGDRSEELSGGKREVEHGGRVDWPGGRRPVDFDIAGAKRELETGPQTRTPGDRRARYLGQIFGLFLLAEEGERLFIIDQHAAHERIIYEQLRNREPEVQNLLVPIHISLENDEEAVLEANLPIYEKLGISLEKQAPGSWLIESCPSVCIDMKDDLAGFIKGWKGDVSDLEQELFATIACRSAVMDGEVLDTVSASELAEEALSLDNARCPHGRPIWVEISRSRLFELVERTV